MVKLPPGGWEYPMLKLGPPKPPMVRIPWEMKGPGLKYTGFVPH
jgi:hypothetical protein